MKSCYSSQSRHRDSVPEYLSKVILHRLLPMTEGESHALVQSLIPTASGYEAWRPLNIQYYGGSEYETTHNTRINDDIQIASLVKSVRGQLRNHLLLNMTETTSFDDIKNTIADFFQSTYVIQQTQSGGHGHQGHQPMEIDQITGFKGNKGKGMSKGPPFKGMGKGKEGKGTQNQIQQWGQSQNQQHSRKGQRKGRNRKAISDPTVGSES
eukprot:1881406-Amphidinium_carterae.2